jgi:hypothetical protein
MLLDVSTRIGTMASRASASALRTTGRSRKTTSARSVMKRSAIRMRRGFGASVRRL